MSCANLSFHLQELTDAPADASVSDFPFLPVRIPTSTDNSVADARSGDSTPMSTPPAAGSESACQHVVDQKAFKGRGTRRKLINAQGAVDKVHEDMRRLAAATRSIKAKQLYLAIHTRTATGQLSLRWRRAGTMDTSHIAWDALDSFFASLPSDLVRWYQTVNVMATALNCQEKLSRALLRNLMESLEPLEKSDKEAR